VRSPSRNDACWCGSGRKYKACHLRRDGTLRPHAPGPTRAVPEEIVRPPYALTDGVPVGPPADLIHPDDVIDRMRRTGALAAEVLRAAGDLVAPGVTTDEIDELVMSLAADNGAYPSPLGYNPSGANPYPRSVCTSVNEVICHGIPDLRPLEDGDIVNIDVTVYREEVHGDTNATFLVGEVDDQSRRLVSVTRQAMLDGIAAVAPGAHLSEIGRAIQSRAEGAGFGVVREFVGHAVGPAFHGPLQIPHYYEPRLKTRIEEGMTFTIEPMISVGSPAMAPLWDDGWTAVTKDGLPTAQFEHTMVVTADGVEILTAQPDAPDNTLDPVPVRSAATG